MVDPKSTHIINPFSKDEAYNSNSDTDRSQNEQVIIKEKDFSDSSYLPLQSCPSGSNLDLDQNLQESAVSPVTLPKRVFVVGEPAKACPHIIFEVSTEHKPSSSRWDLSHCTSQSTPNESGSECSVLLEPELFTSWNTNSCIKFPQDPTRQLPEHTSIEHQALSSSSAFAIGSTSSQSVLKVTNQDFTTSSPSEQPENLKHNAFIVQGPTKPRAEHTIFGVFTEHEPSTSRHGFANHNDSTTPEGFGPMQLKPKSDLFIPSQKAEYKKPVIQEEVPEPMNFRARNFTKEEIELLMLHTENFFKWEEAKKEKHSQLFKRTTIKAKDLHRKLKSSMGYDRLMEETHGWDPVEWDWDTFEKKQRSSVKGNRRELLRAVERAKGMSGGDAIVAVIRAARGFMDG